MKDVAFLGDTHLGRRFKTGVPLHRLGDREAMVREQFQAELMQEQPEVHIHLGDLFDKPVVSPDDVLFAAETYLEAARRYPETDFYVLEGNHDASRNTLVRTSFDLFEAIVSQLPNITVVREPLLVHRRRVGLCPYNVFGTAEDHLRVLLKIGTPDLVAGHWDVAFGDGNLIPTALMQEAGIKYAVTGHDHLKRMERRHGVDIEVFGSMQPYGHAEDADSNWYVTLELHEVLELPEEERRYLNIRVLLNEGEVLPTDIDCLSMIGKRITSDETLEVDTSDFDQFDLRGALAAAIPERIRDRVMAVYNA